MNFKHILTATLLMSTVLPSVSIADSRNERVDLMKQELNRNMSSLALPRYPTPYVMSYSYSAGSFFVVSGRLGAIVGEQSVPMNKGAVHMWLGDDEMTNDFKYNRYAFPIRMPMEYDSKLMLREFWLTSDVAYKNSLQMLMSKAAYLKNNPQSEKLRDLKDIELAKDITYVDKVEADLHYDKAKLHQYVKELSAIFANYPKLYNSSVTIQGVSQDIDKVTSSNVTLNHKATMVNLTANASVASNDGIQISDQFALSALNVDELPAIDELKKKVDKFAKELNELADLERVSEFYSGPVLFDGSASTSLFTSNLLGGNKLIAQRTEIGKPMPRTLESRIGLRVLDTRLSVIHYSNLKEYNDKKLWGQVEVDAEGFKPQPEQTLIENGMLKSVLAGSTQTPGAENSTGNAQYCIDPGNITYITAPATVHIKVDKGAKYESMKKTLIKAAKEEGLPYAYRISRLAGRASVIYQIDVKTGEEKRVRFADISGLDLAKLKRIEQISKEENVINYRFANRVPSSLIAPKAILLNDVELNVPELQQDVKFYTPNSK